MIFCDLITNKLMSNTHLLPCFITTDRPNPATMRICTPVFFTMALIDIRTAIVLTGLLSGLMSLVLYALKRSYPPSVRGLGEWSAALLVVFVGGLLAAGRGKLPEFFSSAAPNFLLCAGVYLLYFGSQRFFGVSVHPWRWLGLITGVVLVTMWFTWITPHYVVRLRWIATLMGLLFASHAWLVLRQKHFSFASVLALLVLMGSAGIQLMRLITSYTEDVGNDILAVSQQQTLYVASFSSAVLLFAVSTILLASERLHAELEQLATHDSLTNALTRRYMDEACRKELERSRRSGRPLALMVLDLDHFKAVNDTYGHQAGDRVLIHFVTQVNALLRQNDLLGRFGGEEFVVLLPETSLDQAQQVAERIRQTAPLGQDQGPSCTVSIGITSNRGANDTVDTLLARADAALYRAKSLGRDRIEVN